MKDMVHLLTVAFLLASGSAPLTDGEVWNEGVTFYSSGDVTNALRVLRPLMVSKSHGARAAEVVAKLEHERGNREEAAVAAQIALRANPEDAKANRNFTRAIDRLSEERATKHINDVLKSAQGKDPSALLKGAMESARCIMTEAGTYRTNEAIRAVARADALGREAETLSDMWIPVREVIAQSVTNQEQAATILQQIEQAQEKTRKAAKNLSDLDASAYGLMSDVEHDFTRFYKLIVMPPAAMGEDMICQSNAWLDVENFNGRAWQQEALDYTRAFRAKFPAWARSYEQQAQSDTNQPPFTAEDQAKVSALATELEKIQLECCEKNLPIDQKKAIETIAKIRDLLPKGKNNDSQNQQNQDKQNQDQQNQDKQNNDQQQNQDQQNQDRQNQDPQEQEQEQEASQEPQTSEPLEDKELEAVLKKAQERNDEHEAEKKARMRKAPLPPNERDW